MIARRRCRTLTIRHSSARPRRSFRHARYLAYSAARHEYGAWGAAFVHGMLTSHRRSLAGVGVIWGIISAGALMLADGQGAFIGFIRFPLICWFAAWSGRALAWFLYPRRKADR